MPIGQRGHLAHDVGNRAVRVPGLALLDEPRVLGEAAGVQEERQAVSVADGSHATQVLEADRLAAARVVGDGDHHQGNGLRAALPDEGVERVEVHVALERMNDRWVPPLLDHQVDRIGPGELHIRPGGIEVRVAGDRLAGSADHAEEDLLGGTPLVGGDHVLEGEEGLDALQEAEPRRRAGVRLVATLDAGPLLGRHGPGAGIGEEVDHHVRGVQVEEVVAGLAEMPVALLDGGHPDRLDALDPERLDDRLPAIHDAEHRRWTDARDRAEVSPA